MLLQAVVAVVGALAVAGRFKRAAHAVTRAYGTAPGPGAQLLTCPAVSGREPQRALAQGNWGAVWARRFHAPCVCMQARTLLDTMHASARERPTEDSSTSCFAIAAGDFNSTPASPLYECAATIRAVLCCVMHAACYGVCLLMPPAHTQEFICFSASPYPRAVSTDALT